MLLIYLVEKGEEEGEEEEEGEAGQNGEAEYAHHLAHSPKALKGQGPTAGSQEPFRFPRWMAGSPSRSPHWCPPGRALAGS